MYFSHSFRYFVAAQKDSYLPTVYGDYRRKDSEKFKDKINLSEGGRMKIFLSILFGILILLGNNFLSYPYAEACFLLAPMVIGILLIKKTSFNCGHKE